MRLVDPRTGAPVRVHPGDHLGRSGRHRLRPRARQKRRVDAKIDRAQGPARRDAAGPRGRLHRSAAHPGRPPGRAGRPRAAAERRAGQGRPRQRRVAVQDLEAAQANEARAVDELAKTDAEVADSRTRVAQFAAQIYQDQGMGQLSVALSAHRPPGVRHRIAMADTVMDVQNQSLDRLVDRAGRGHAPRRPTSRPCAPTRARQEAAAEAALARPQTAPGRRAAAAKADLDALAAQQSAAGPGRRAQGRPRRHRLAAHAGRADPAAQGPGGRGLGPPSAAARARAASERAARAAASRAQPALHATTARALGATSAAPCNAPVSSEFGMRYHPILHYWRLHAGRDYARRLRHPGLRRRRRHDHLRRLGRRLRQPARDRPRIVHAASAWRPRTTT